jgi:tetratricopeptide (TPR) repeat protein
VGNSGIAMRRSDRFDEAEALFRALTERDPENPVWWWQLGLVYAEQSRFEDALPAYKRVVEQLEGRPVGGSEMDRELRLAWLRMGNSLRQVAAKPHNADKRAALLEKAEEAIRRFVAENPDSALGPKWMGVLLLESHGRPHDAEPWFRQAWELDRVCDDSLRYLIQIHEQHGPPPGPDGPRDPEAERRALEAWRAPVAAWRKDLEENEEKRKKERERREDRDGSDGCL